MSEDLRDQFGAISQEEKLENFELSTLKLVLEQLGMPRAVVKSKVFEYSKMFSWDLFNSENYIKPWVSSVRCFNYNFLELYEKPRGHPLLKEIVACVEKGIADKDLIPGDPYIVIFKAYDHGRMVATNLQLTDRTHIHVVLSETEKLNITPFKGFFAERYGKMLEEE